MVAPRRRRAAAAAAADDDDDGDDSGGEISNGEESGVEPVTAKAAAGMASSIVMSLARAARRGMGRWLWRTLVLLCVIVAVVSIIDMPAPRPYVFPGQPKTGRTSLLTRSRRAGWRPAVPQHPAGTAAAWHLYRRQLSQQRRRTSPTTFVVARRAACPLGAGTPAR